MDHDTTLGGQGRNFPVTRGSVIRDVAAAEPEVRERALETLIAAYWKPAYTYIRIRWSAGNEEAKDLVQGFFAKIVETELILRFDPAKARFRTYLRTCLDGYIANQRKAEGRLKRGGGAAHLPIEDDLASDALSTDDPDVLFDREWIRELFAYAVEALRARCASAGKQLAFQIFEDLDIDGPNSPVKPSYADLAQKYQVPITQVNNYLAFARREFRTVVVDRLHEITGDEAEFRSEARRLLGVDVP
jgi:RNA polymerase sigma factor (sigma-70 family)